MCHQLSPYCQFDAQGHQARECSAEWGLHHKDVRLWHVSTIDSTLAGSQWQRYRFNCNRRFRTKVEKEFISTYVCKVVSSAWGHIKPIGLYYLNRYVEPGMHFRRNVSQKRSMAIVKQSIVQWDILLSTVSRKWIKYWRAKHWRLIGKNYNNNGPSRPTYPKFLHKWRNVIYFKPSKAGKI